MAATGDLAGRLIDSIGEAVYEDATGFVIQPEPRTTWIELQRDVVAEANRLDPTERRVLAHALLRAILEQPSFGPTNRLDPDAFDVLLGSLGDDLAAVLVPGAGDQYGGARYVVQHLWAVPGAAGARWLTALADADPGKVSSLLQAMMRGEVPRWADTDWPARLAVFETLTAEPRPSCIDILPRLDFPPLAVPAFVRVALAHAVDERDHLARAAAAELRTAGARPDGSPWVDWRDAARRPELFRWILELAVPGERAGIVEAAASAGHLDSSVSDFLSAPLDRPAWADRDVPWVVADVQVVGTLDLPSGRLIGGDPWWTGGHEGVPWMLQLDTHSLPVSVVTAEHPLFGRGCAALMALVQDQPPDSWQLLETSKAESEGYRVEVGVAGIGAPECYESGVVFDLPFEPSTEPRWQLVDAGQAGRLAMCSVVHQHQLCRTWVGRSRAGQVVAVVTDLGLLDSDLEADPVPPWT